MNISLTIEKSKVNPYFEIMDPHLQTCRWMEQYWNIISDKRIYDVVLPGTHDSGSYSCSFENGVAPFAPKILRRKCLTRYMKNVAIDWTKTNEYNLLQQLMKGARYLDLRVCISTKDNEIRTEHFIYGETYDSLLDQIYDFIRTQPKEFIILDFSHFQKKTLYSMTIDDHKRFVSMIQNKIGKYLVTKTEISLTLDELLEKNHRIFAVYHLDEIAYQYSYLLPSQSMFNHWTNTQSSDTLIKALKKTVIEFDKDTHPNTVFFSLQSCITPNRRMIVNSIKQKYFNSCKKKNDNTPKSLYDVAEEANAELIKWFESYNNTIIPFNIVLVDYLEKYRNLVILIINMNKM